MPPLRTRPPGSPLRTRRAMHVEHAYDPYLHHNIERRERQQATDLATDWESTGLHDWGYELYQRLHVREVDHRDQMLQRLERSPTFHDAVQNYWDIMDSRDLFIDLTRVLGDIRRRYRDRARLHHMHLDHEFLRLLAIGLDHTLVAIAPGVGTPEDPVDLDLFLTASEAEDHDDGAPAPPTLEERLSLPQADPGPPPGLASRLSDPPDSIHSERRPYGSEGSEVDSTGQIYHARDGRPCHSMFAHGPDYSTDEVLERDLHAEEDFMEYQQNALASLDILREMAAEGDSDFSIHRNSV